MFLHTHGHVAYWHNQRRGTQGRDAVEMLSVPAFPCDKRLPAACRSSACGTNSLRVGLCVAHCVVLEPGSATRRRTCICFDLASGTKQHFPKRGFGVASAYADPRLEPDHFGRNSSSTAIYNVELNGADLLWCVVVVCVRAQLVGSLSNLGPLENWSWALRTYDSRSSMEECCMTPFKAHGL